MYYQTEINTCPFQRQMQFTMPTPSMTSPSYYQPYASQTESRAIAVATLSGSPAYPQIRGSVGFIDIPGGTQVCVYVTGLPAYRPAQDGNPPIGPHGFHIHEYGNCTVGNPEQPFQAAGGHWNPDNNPHGNHAGDFPVLFSNSGVAAMCFFTNRFKVSDIIGRSVIIHENPDDYRTQPAGNSGERIACGVIR